MPQDSCIAFEPAACLYGHDSEVAFPQTRGPLTDTVAVIGWTSWIALRSTVKKKKKKNPAAVKRFPALLFVESNGCDSHGY